VVAWPAPPTHRCPHGSFNPPRVAQLREEMPAASHAARASRGWNSAGGRFLWAEAQRSVGACSIGCQCSAAAAAAAVLAGSMPLALRGPLRARGPVTDGPAYITELIDNSRAACL
jgi:hypothetical protein